MAQADLNVANQSGAAFRSDLNGQLLALGTLQSGATAPSTTYAYMQWADTTTGLLKIRDAANAAWITIGTLASPNLGLATLASPTFTGTPAAPTASTGTNTTQLATTAYVVSQATAKAGDTMTGNLTVPSLNSGCLAGTRNRIINGDMRIAQRGTSFANPANGSYCLDRWFVASTGTAVASISQVTGTGSYQNAARITGAAGNTQAGFVQRIESYNVSDLSGATVTISATLVASANQTVAWNLQYATSGTDNWATGGTAVANGTWSVTTTAQTFTATIANLPANSVRGLQLFIFANNGGAFTSGTLDITGAQLEVGTVATPFERRSYGQELALCQRYYEAQTTTGVTMWPPVSNNAGNISARRVWVPFVVTKRAAPTLSIVRTQSLTSISTTAYTNGFADAGDQGSFLETIITSWSASIEL